MPPLIHHRTVEFHETDAAGLVHFSNYLRYAEAAEHALFREINYPIMLETADGDFFGWPRVRADAKYSAPLQSGDPIRVQLEIKALKDRAGFIFGKIRAPSLRWDPAALGGENGPSQVSSWQRRGPRRFAT